MAVCDTSGTCPYWMHEAAHFNFLIKQGFGVEISSKGEVTGLQILFFFKLISYFESKYTHWSCKPF